MVLVLSQAIHMDAVTTLGDIEQHLKQVEDAMRKVG
jgi:hypothetical protein